MSSTLAALEAVVTRGDIGAAERRVCDVVGYLISQNGEIVLANKRAEELIGVPGMVGMRLSDVVGKYAREAHDKWVDEWVAAGRITREMGDRIGPTRHYAITITTCEWRKRPAEMAVILPSTQNDRQPA